MRIVPFEAVAEAKLEYAEWEDLEIILVDGKPGFILLDDIAIPTIYLLLKVKVEEYYVTVDMGAVPYVTNGADVMVPGIVEVWEGIKKGDAVWVRDERYHKPLCVGIALMDREEILEREKGKAVKNLHYVGDKIWKNLILG